MKTKKTILYSNNPLDYIDYEETKTILQKDYEIKEPTFEQIFNFANEEIYDLNIAEDFLDNLKSCFNKDDFFISTNSNTSTFYNDFYPNANKETYRLFGNISWDSKVKTLEEAIYCQNYYEVKIIDINNHLFFQHIDHDFNTIEEIRILTNLGYETLMRWYDYEGKLNNLSHFEIYKKLYNDPHYSKLPRLKEKINLSWLPLENVA